MNQWKSLIRPVLLPLLLLVAAPVAMPEQAAAQSPVAAADAAPTTIYVYRHAERASDTDRDPPLSTAGQARAEALAHALEMSGISAIYVTPYLRTRQTAEPLAERLGIELADSGNPRDVNGLARRVLEQHRGESVMIVGHSNTVPAIVHAFGGPELEDFEASRYGDLFILMVSGDGGVRVVQARVDPVVQPATTGGHHDG